MADMSAPTPFSVKVEKSSSTCVLKVAGELDIATVGHLRLAFKSCGNADLVVDLAELTFIDSTGLGAFIEHEQRCSATGNAFSLINPSKPMLRLLEVAGLTKRFLRE